MSNLYDQWRLLEWWVRLPNWARIGSGAVVLWAAYGCFGLEVPGFLLGAVGLLMLLHGLFASPESGPPP